MRMQLFVFLLTGLWVNTLGAKLPYYMKKCNLKDPKLNQCIKNNGNQAIPILVRGDSSIGIPRLSPVITPKFNLNSKRFNLILTNVIFDNFKDMVITAINFDLKKRKYNLTMTCRYLTFNSTYILKDSQILTKTLSGNGRFEMKLVDNIIKYSADMIVYKKGRKNYLKSTNGVMKLESKSMLFRFTNLSSTNKGNKDINAFLQENWKVIHHKVNPDVEKFLKSKIEAVLTAVEDNVIAEDIFINGDLLTKDLK